MSRCPKRCRAEPTPEGMPLDVVAVHPRYAYRLEPGAQCELELEHDGPHRNGGLIWHDPPIVYVADELFGMRPA